MKGWLAANLFLVGLAAVAALTFFLGHHVIVLLALTDVSQRVGYGVVAVLSIFVSAGILKTVLEQIERRR